MRHPGAELRPELLATAGRLREFPLVLVAAPAGSGKTTLLEAWRSALSDEGAVTAWLSLTALHRDPAFFIEDLAAEVVASLGATAGDERFAARLLRQLPHLADPDPERIAALFARELRKLHDPLHLFLDGYEQLEREGAVDRLVSALARDRTLALRLAIATRGARPAATPRLLVEQRALTLGPDDLSLRADQVERLLRAQGVDPDPDVALRLLAETRGWVTGVRIAAGALVGRGRDEALDQLATLARQPDLFGYLAAELLADVPEPVLSLLESVAYLGRVPRALLQAIAGEIGGAARIDEALDRGLLSVDRDGLGLHPLWSQLLRERAAARLPREEFARIADRWVTQLDVAGLPERAIEVSAELGLADRTAALLARHGLGWLERGGYDSVERWLAAAGENAATLRPELALLEALLLSRRDPDAGLDALEAVADRFRAAGDDDAEVAALHNAVILAANANRTDRARRASLRIVGLRRLVTSPRARAAALGFVAMGAYLTGRYRLARRVSDRAARFDFAPRERAGLAIGRVRLATLAGEWERALELADDALADPELSHHAPGLYTLEGFRALLRGHLGLDLESALRRVEEARDACAAFRLGVTEVHLDVALAYLLEGEDRADAAREVVDRAARRAAELGFDDGLAASHVLLARLHLAAGRSEAGRAAAEAALAHATAAGLRRAPWNAAFAAAVLADAGDAQGALAFVRSHKGLDCADLPMMQHAIHVALARVADRAGDDVRARRHLERAWRAAAAADLCYVSPELGRPLVEWAVARAEEFAWARPAVARLTILGEAPPWLRIETLGGVRVWHHGREVGAAAWRGTTTRRLLIRLLVARGRPVPRERIEADLWPEIPAARAKNNLRVTLSRLRRVLEPDRGPGDPERCLQIDSECIAVADPYLETWDVARFERLVAEATRRSGADALGARSEAFAEQRGPFAPEVLDEWTLELRASLEQACLSNGHALASALLAGGDAARARDVAARLVTQVPSDETSWGLLAEAELAAGDRGAALRTLARAEQVLMRELGLAPGPELRVLAEQARSAPGERPSHAR